MFQFPVISALWKIDAQREKRKEQSCAVQSLIQVFQTGNGYFLGMCVECHFAGRRSVKMLSLANNDDKKKEKMLQHFSSEYKDFLFIGESWHRDYYMSADGTSTFCLAGTWMQTCQPRRIHHVFFMDAWKKTTDLRSSQKYCGNFFPHQAQVTSVSNFEQ